MPGDLFALRLQATLAGSEDRWQLEMSAVQIGINLILVMGHTHCGVVAGVAQTYLASKDGEASKNADLMGLPRLSHCFLLTCTQKTDGLKLGSWDPN